MNWWNWENFSFHCFTVPVNAMTSGQNFTSWRKFGGFLVSFSISDRIFCPYNTIIYGSCSIDPINKNIWSWTIFSRYRATKWAGYHFLGPFWSFLPIFCLIIGHEIPKKPNCWDQLPQYINTKWITSKKFNLAVSLQFSVRKLPFEIHFWPILANFSQFWLFLPYYGPLNSPNTPHLGIFVPTY